MSEKIKGDLRRWMS